MRTSLEGTSRPGSGCASTAPPSPQRLRCGAPERLREAAASPLPVSRMSDLVGLFNLLAPFFGLIALGFFCGKTVRRPESGLAWMQFFLVYAALPCLFYRLIADKPLEQLLNWSYVLATTLCTAVAFALSFGAGLWQTRGDMPPGGVEGGGGAESHNGLIGPPLGLS